MLVTQCCFYIIAHRDYFDHWQTLQRSWTFCRFTSIVKLWDQPNLESSLSTFVALLAGFWLAAKFAIRFFHSALSFSSSEFRAFSWCISARLSASSCLKVSFMCMTQFSWWCSSWYEGVPDIDKVLCVRSVQLLCSPSSTSKACYYFESGQQKYSSYVISALSQNYFAQKNHGKSRNMFWIFNFEYEWFN